MTSTLRRVYSTISPTRSREAVVLLYHRIGPRGTDPWQLAVRPNHFDEHIEVLRTCTTLTAADLGRALDAGLIPRRSVVLTFDDGYADLVNEVHPRLVRADLRATAFLVSRAIDRTREFWWDQVEHAVLGRRRPRVPLRLTLGGESLTIDPGAGVSRAQLHRDVWTLLRGQLPAERDRLAESLLSWAGISATPRRSRRTLSADELERLARDDRIEIGGHTADHVWLGGLSQESAATQIDVGRAELEARIGRRLVSFAYPHGGHGDVGDTRRAVQSAGFSQAFTALAGTVRVGADRLLLPRIPVADIDGEGLARLLWQHAGIRVS